MGWKVAPRKEKEDFVNKFNELRRQGKSVSEIEKELGKGRAHYYKWSKDLGQQTRKSRKSKTRTPYMQITAQDMPKEPTFTMTKRQLLTFIDTVLSLKNG
jgi:transposase